MQKILVLCAFFALFNFSNAQETKQDSIQTTQKETKKNDAFRHFTSYFVVQAGYTYWNGSFFTPGLEYYFVQPNNNIFDIGARVQLGYMRDQFIAIPELGLGYQFNFKGKKADPYSDNFNASFYVIRANVSPWTITPEVGFGILGLFEFNVGYGFDTNEKKDFKSMEGLKFGFMIHLPMQLF